MAHTPQDQALAIAAIERTAAVLPRDGHAAGVPCWVDTAQPDLDAARRFYGGLFDWEFHEWTPGRYLVARRDGLDVAGIAHEPGAPPAWSTYVAVDSADEATADAIQLAATVLVPPFDVGGAGRMAVIADPIGGVFRVWESRGHGGAELVNAAGSWSWSDLLTPDPSLAEPFYRALFGWETTAVTVGGRTSTLWRRPGHGDAIGGLLQADGPPRWSVTFAVDDTDAAAARAAGLGAEILVPPYDAGPTRVATIRDPQGAVLSISHHARP